MQGGRTLCRLSARVSGMHKLNRLYLTYAYKLSAERALPSQRNRGRTPHSWPVWRRRLIGTAFDHFHQCARHRARPGTGPCKAWRGMITDQLDRLAAEEQVLQAVVPCGAWPMGCGGTQPGQCRDGAGRALGAAVCCAFPHQRGGPRSRATCRKHMLLWFRGSCPPSALKSGGGPRVRPRRPRRAVGPSQRCSYVDRAAGASACSYKSHE